MRAVFAVKAATLAAPGPDTRAPTRGPRSEGWGLALGGTPARQPAARRDIAIGVLTGDPGAVSSTHPTIVMARPTSLVLLFLSIALVSCSTPAPRAWLRYQPAGATTWVTGQNGLLTSTMHGAPVTLDLGRRQTRAEVTVQNTTSQRLEFRMGPEAGHPRQAIGEVLLRPFSGPPGAGGPDMIAYNAMQPVVVEPGWRGTFYLDAPLGREPSIGQYFVLTVEARNPDGVCERHSLPLQATNAGVISADGR